MTWGAILIRHDFSVKDMTDRKYKKSNTARRQRKGPVLFYRFYPILIDAFCTH